MNPHNNPTEDELKLAWSHAGELIAKYDWLTAQSVLARLLTGAYRNPPGRPGVEFRDGDILSDDDARKALQLFVDMRTLAREMLKLDFYPRKLVARVVEQPGAYSTRDLAVGISAILGTELLDVPRSNAMVILNGQADMFARYVVLVTNARAATVTDPKFSTQRAFFGDVLSFAGWSFDDDEINAAWAMATHYRFDSSAKSAGLSLMREERAELKQWYADRGIA